LNAANIKISEIKFLCSDWIIILKVLTGVSISPETVFHKSIFEIFSLRNEWHFLQIIS
jgi:hypothetical protein